ncbi:hypothetical protein N781_02335 [Pontibacillus halophilus JSM 076056 = DSM 19796]|uniref:DUF3298 domain-containing protein n=1 Tax=Pontibacillus halophilus JSM 076056 = DSM 19796 TaxID=1385510 RepID=A0A0A5GLF6_9BACI|nr:DUF3298 and DUF4163 domain-containing protein [Pontibacillus halophilus]KGX94111.1 hypothetical protein N781_02335 [Pontibacillus halophilus JSM 076056 = DSM 19796]
MRKFVYVALMAIVGSAIWMTFTSAAEEANRLWEEKVYKETSSQLEVNVTYPHFIGLEDEAFQKKLNKRIEKRVKQTIADVKEEADETPGFPYILYMTYDVKQDVHFYSVVLREETSRGNNFDQRVHSYNFENIDEASFVPIKEYVPNVDELNKAIKRQIDQRPNEFFTGDEGFKGVRDNQPYYVEDGKITVIFNKYEIAPGYVGTPEFTIPLDEIQ